MTPEHLSSRRRRARVALVAMAVGGAMALGGCAPTPAPAPTPTPLFASEEEAFAAAEATYRAYIDAASSLEITNPDSFQAVAEVTTGTVQSDERKSFSEMRAAGAVQNGNVTVVWFRGLEASTNGFVRAQICEDVSRITVVDASGASLVSPTRPPRIAIEFTTVPAPKQSLLIATTTPFTDPSCSE